MGIKVRDAIATPHIKIVRFEWLSDSLKASAKVDETPYLLTQSGLIATTPSKTASPSLVASDPTSTIVNLPENTPKRPLDDENGEPASQTSLKRRKSAKDGQKARSASVSIPVDEVYCKKNDHTGTCVYIDEHDTIYDATLNLTNSLNNNNKFYKVQVLKTKRGYFAWTRWGRVGEGGQSRELGDGTLADALEVFKSKFGDKCGLGWADRSNPSISGKYTFVERQYESATSDEDEDLPGTPSRNPSRADSQNPETPRKSKLPGSIQRLMQLIFNQEYVANALAEMGYDATRMPLGQLSKRTLLQGYDLLNDLTGLINDFDSVSSVRDQNIRDRSDQYFSLIPHAFGRRQPPVLDVQEAIQREVEMIETLTDLSLTNDVMKAAKAKREEKLSLLDRQYGELGMQEMTPLGNTSTEFLELNEYLHGTVGRTHGLRYKVQDIFRIERAVETARFESSQYASLPASQSDRRLLWHGSRCTNFGGILSQGLRIGPPEAPANGYMFGKGVYFADMSSKSANYCRSSASNDVGLLLLCEVELGRPALHELAFNYNAEQDAKRLGRLSVRGEGSTAPVFWRDASCVNKTLKGVQMPDLVTPPRKQPGAAAGSLHYNEYIVYDVAQVRQRYLFRVEITNTRGVR